MENRDLYWPMTKEVWFKLPITVRKRWWRETNYSKELPSEELEQIIIEILTKRNQDDSSRCT